MSGFDYQLLNMQKQQARESAIGVIAHAQQQFNSVPVNTVKERMNHRPVQHRESTLAKQEQRAFYDKFNPDNGVCPKCFTILSNSGACAGACFD